jgi:Formate/nitrite transporter
VQAESFAGVRVGRWRPVRAISRRFPARRTHSGRQSARRRRITELTWNNFFVSNLLPVTIGNIIGGSIMVAAVYWFVYLRKKNA